MALFDDLSEGMRKAFLAGVGAVAMGAEKSQELIDDLVKRGELTVEQGKSINEELSRKVRETTESASDELLRSRLRGMTPEQRAEWLARAQKISDDLEAEDAEYEVADEPQDAPADAPADAPETPADVVEDVVEAVDDDPADEEA